MLITFSGAGSNQISDMDDNGSTNGESAAQTKELFLPFHVYCARKDVSIQDSDIFAFIILNSRKLLFLFKLLDEVLIRTGKGFEFR